MINVTVAYHGVRLARVRRSIDEHIAISALPDELLAHLCDFGSFEHVSLRAGLVERVLEVVESVPIVEMLLRAQTNDALVVRRASLWHLVRTVGILLQDLQDLGFVLFVS